MTKNIFYFLGIKNRFQEEKKFKPIFFIFCCENVIVGYNSTGKACRSIKGRK